MEAIIVGCLAVLVIIGGVSFFADPRYEKGVWIVLGAVTNLLSAAAGAKFGLAVPKIGIGVREGDGEGKAASGSPDTDPGDRSGYRVGFAPGVDGEPAKRI